MECTEDTVAFAIGKHFNCHFDTMSIQNAFDTFSVVSALLFITAELVQVL